MFIASLGDCCHLDNDPGIAVSTSRDFYIIGILVLFMGEAEKKGVWQRGDDTADVGVIVRCLLPAATTAEGDEVSVCHLGTRDAVPVAPGSCLPTEKGHFLSRETLAGGDSSPDIVFFWPFLPPLLLSRKTEVNSEEKKNTYI